MRQIFPGLFLVLGLSAPLDLLAQIGEPTPAEAVAPAPANFAFGCVVSPSQKIFSANTQTTAVLQVVLNAPGCLEPARRPALNLCLVLDGSGSMAGPKLEQAKQAALQALKQLGPQDWFSLIVLGQDVDTLVPSQSVTDRAAIERKILAIRAGGGTSLFGGLSRAATEVRRHMAKAFVHRIVVLSDGAANEGPSSARLLERLGLSLLKENISVSTIGIGESFNEDLLSRLAGKSDGNFHFAEQESQLPAILKKEMDDLLCIVAQDVDLNLELLGGAEPVKVLGRIGFITDNKVCIPLNQLYAGENTTLVEVNLPPNAPSATTHIANVWADFRNGLTYQVDRVDAKGQVAFSTNQAAVQDSEVSGVQKAMALANAGLAQEQALVWYNDGNVKGAWSLIKGNADDLERAGNRYQDARLQRQSQQMKQVEQQVEQQSLDNRSQKLMRNESYNLRRSNNRPGF